ncbi:MAG: two-component system sensor histidine kinase NtrB [Thermodesulfobacteriota bacterium]
MNSEALHHFNVALIHPGEIIQNIFSLAREYDLQAFFPEIQLIGITGEGLSEEQKHIADAAGIKIYPDYRRMLDKDENIDTIVILKNDPKLLKRLREELSPEVSILDYRAALFIWEVVVQERLCLSCQTHLSHTQTLLRTILDEVREDILLLDVNKKIVDVNQNVYLRLGLDKEDLIGQPCWKTWSRDGESCKDKKYPCPFDTVLKTGKKAEALHTRVDNQGHLSYFRVYVYPITNAQNQITNLVEMRRDITHRTYMEKRLQQSEKLAAIGELSTYIAHEIRNPLFAIGGFANSLLRVPELGKKARKKVQIILDESKRLDGILKSILNFARPTEAKTTEVDVNKIVTQTMDLMEIGCRKQRIEVNMHLQEDLAQARGNPEFIKQGLINIVKNAMEVMPEGGMLDIKTSICDQYICIMVIDSGPGIAAGIQEKIFNPFFSTKEKGSGLGLAMTKKTIEDMGGKVELKSKPDEGTCVTLLLPPVLALETQKDPNVNI